MVFGDRLRGQSAEENSSTYTNEAICGLGDDEEEGGQDYAPADKKEQVNWAKKRFQSLAEESARNEIPKSPEQPKQPKELSHGNKVRL